jgi:predicted  nucleic acid-binding Zn-ribbon protein
MTFKADLEKVNKILDEMDIALKDVENSVKLLEKRMAALEQRRN